MTDVYTVGEIWFWRQWAQLLQCPERSSLSFALCHFIVKTRADNLTFLICDDDSTLTALSSPAIEHTRLQTET